MPTTHLAQSLVAGIGMVISAQWEFVLGNSFGYTALSAFGMFILQFPTSLEFY